MKIKYLLSLLSLCFVLAFAQAQEGEAKIYPQQHATPEAYAAAGGEEIASFAEAPTLAEQVEAGELPPVAERLPQEPLVIEPLNEVGSYGGELAGPSIVPTCCGWDAIEARLS